MVRNPDDSAEWGIFYNPDASPERRRFTVAHEFGHFVLHRDRQPTFNCDKASVHLGLDSSAVIEREADDFASNLLMPGDVVRDLIASRRIDLHVLSEIARRFEVSFEALCLRFIKYTDQRAILVYWDNGFLKYEWRSKKAVRTRARVRRTSDPAEPPPGTLAADEGVVQEWDGVELPASTWCPEEAPYMKLREFKHSYGARDRVLTLLLLESAEPRPWDRSWQDEEAEDTADRFAAGSAINGGRGHRASGLGVSVVPLRPAPDTGASQAGVRSRVGQPTLAASRSYMYCPRNSVALLLRLSPAA